MQASKPKIKAAVIQPESSLEKMKKQYRNESSEVGPGAYDTSKPFGSDVKIVKITAPSRVPRKEESPGPGVYKVEDADKFTRTKSVSVIINKTDSRPKTFALQNQQDIGPGYYDDGKKFGQDVKPVTIAPEQKPKKTDQKGGPGTYNADKAIDLIKPRPKSAVISRTQRKTDVAIKPQGPEQSYNPQGFADKLKSSKSQSKLKPDTPSRFKAGKQS